MKKTLVSNRIATKNQNGFGLIEVMIAVGITGIMMMAMLAMQSAQSKENRALAEKLGALDTSRFVTFALAKQSTCNALFISANLPNPSDLTFDATNTSAAQPHVINILQIAGYGSSVAVSSMSPTLQLQTTNGIQLLVTSPNSGTLALNFDQTKLVHPIHNLSFPLSLQSTGPLNNLTLQGCQMAGMTQRTVLNLAVLAAYLPSANLASWDGTCNAIVASSTLSLFFESACKRYCTLGCTPPSCDAAHPGQGYGTGVLSECNNTSVPQTAECDCVP